MNSCIVESSEPVTLIAGGPVLARDLCAAVSDQLGLPCTDPVTMGVEPIIDELLCTENSTSGTTAFA